MACVANVYAKLLYYLLYFFPPKSAGWLHTTFQEHSPEVKK